MKLNANKWYKNSNLLGITTQNNKHLCNIFLPSLLQICDEYDVKNGTIIVNDLLQLLDASYEVFETKETKMFQNVKQHYADYVDEIFDQRYWNEQHLEQSFDQEFRLEYNLKIVDKLKQFFEQNLHQRFFQGLFNLGIVEYSKPYSGQILDKFSEESKKTFNKLCDK